MSWLVTLPETNTAPENGWMEYLFPLGRPILVVLITLFLPESWKWKIAIFERYLLSEAPIFHFHDYRSKCNIRDSTTQLYRDCTLAMIGILINKLAF